MAAIEDFILRFKTVGTAAIQQAGNAIGGLKDDIADFAQVGGPLQNTLNGIVGKMGPLGLAAGVAGTAFAGLAGRALQLAGDLSDIAGATGIATGTLLNFRQSIVEAGGKAEDFGQIAAKLNQSIQEAAGGNARFQESFRALGVFVTDANGQLRPTESILRDIVDRFRSGQLTAAQYSAAIDILGKNINKLELAKLQAIADPIKDEQIRQLDQYNEQIDKLGESFNNLALTIVGSVATAINRFISDLDRVKKQQLDLEKAANEQGKTYRERTEGLLNNPLFGPQRAPLSGQSVPIPERLRDFTEKEKEAYNQQIALEQKLKDAYADRAREEKLLLDKGKPGGFGPKSADAIAAEAKAVEASQKRIRQIRIEQQRETDLTANAERLSAILQFADEESAIEERLQSRLKEIQINQTAETARARLEIFAQENLSREQLTKEFTAKEKEISLKSQGDIAKARAQAVDQTVKLQEKLQQTRKQEEERTKKETERIQDIITQSKARVSEEERFNDILSQRNQFAINNATATDKERQRAEQLFALEEERLRVLREIALTKGLEPEARLAREKEINAIFDQRKVLTQNQQEADQRLQRNFSQGFEKAYRQYIEDSQNAFSIAGRVFGTTSKGMEDAIVNFAKTGKFEFKNFANMVLEELLRIQIQKTFASLLGGGAGSGVGGFFGRLLGFANGGIIPTNAPVVVGERGPELLVGASGNRVIPNDQLGGGSITYNINAVDAPSFKQLIASDPSFIYAVTEQGRRRAPATRR